MAGGAPPPPIPPHMGKGASKQRMRIEHEIQTKDGDNPHLRNVPKKRQRLHKLMRSGTFKGKFVKFFYKLIVDPWYK